jgi:hypothetical protein
MWDSKIECTLPRIAGIRTQITIPEKRTEIFAIGATLAPPQVSYGFHY